MAEEITGRAAGGIARKKSTTAKQRKDTAAKAAKARWEIEDLPVSVTSEDGAKIRLADSEIDAYVLEDGTRVLSQAGFLTALGRHRRAGVRTSETPPMLQGKAFEPFLSDDLLDAAQPVVFRTRSGLRAYGYRAELLPQVCEVYLKARDAKTLAPNQKPFATQADILMRAFAKVGIIALVDEATGYQDVRARDALAKILEQYIEKDLQAWVRTFPDDFYREIFRLRGLGSPTERINKPAYFGHLTNDIVYKRLAPGVLDELRRVTPRDDKRRTKHRFFQRLTANHGYPRLREHLGSVVTAMKLSKDWADFTEKLDRLHPRYGETQKLPYPDNGTGL